MRKGQAKLRIAPEDPIYGSRLVTKLINRSMRDGKKTVVSKQIYRALEQIRAESGSDPLQLFIQAIEQIKPNMEVRPRRIGGATYQVPQPVRGPRREALAIRWLVNAANSLPNSTFRTYGAKLAAEIQNAVKGEGAAMAKKQEMERTAEANKAFAHFRW